MSPTARSLKFLRDRGWTAQVVERWNQFAKVRQDLFGFADIVAIHPQQQGVLAVQSTSFPNRLARLRKVCAEPRALIWVQAGNAIEIHGWRKESSGWAPNSTPVMLKEKV